MAIIINYAQSDTFRDFRFSTLCSPLTLLFSFKNAHLTMFSMN